MNEAASHLPRAINVGRDSAFAGRLIVAVPWGPLSGKKAVIAAGSSLSFGRTAFAGFIVPHDRQMSGVHFEIAWDGKRISVRDLGSVTGTLIDGEPGRTEGEIESGGFVKAGETIFTVHVEGATPKRDEETDDEDDDPRARAAKAREVERQRAAEVALKRLSQEASTGHLYAVLDAARDDRITELVREAVDESRSLYEGVEGEALADVAPYLVKIEPESRLLPKLVQEGWGKRWGIYLVSDEPFKEVRRHLRRFLMVQDEQTNEQLYFRFYDPIVLATFLSASTAAEVEVFMRAVGCFLSEDDLGGLKERRR